MICPKSEENFTRLMLLRPSRLAHGLPSTRMVALAFMGSLLPALHTPKSHPSPHRDCIPKSVIPSQLRNKPSTTVTIL